MSDSSTGVLDGFLVTLAAIPKKARVRRGRLAIFEDEISAEFSDSASEQRRMLVGTKDTSIALKPDCAWRRKTADRFILHTEILGLPRDHFRENLAINYLEPVKSQEPAEGALVWIDPGGGSECRVPEGMIPYVYKVECATDEFEGHIVQMSEDGVFACSVKFDNKACYYSLTYNSSSILIGEMKAGDYERFCRKAE